MFSSNITRSCLLWVALAVACTTLSVGCVRKSQSKEGSMSLKEPAVTHCIGRYLIDLPAAATYVGSTDSYDFAKIHVNEMSHDAFRKEVEVFEARLRATKHKTDASLLLNLTGQKSEMPVFAYWEESYSSVAVDLAGYKWINGLRYLLQSDADPDKSTPESRHISEIVTKIQPRNSDIPAGKGFCIRGAIIADDEVSDEESTSVSFRLKDKPDVLIQLSTTRNLATPPETLLSRKPSVFSALGVLGAALGGLQTLKEGDRTINGIAGQEWLVRAPNDHKFQSHLFTWEAQGRANDTMHPQVRIELQTATYGRGVAPAAPSLTDEQATRLWDQILSTLRLRPTSQKSNSVVAAHSVPLGTISSAGKVCPQTGWWRCIDGDARTDVGGGRVQYLREGQTVPQALLLPLATPWQKLRGEQPSFKSEVPSSWKLVDRRTTPRTAPSTFLVPAGLTKLLVPGSEIKQPKTDVVLSQQAKETVGAQLSSGEICTASGWWQCLERGALDNTRWFSNGGVLPPATKPVSLTVFEKMKGLPGFVRVSANWRLIRSADSETPVPTEGGATSVASSSEPAKDGSDLPEGT